MGIFKQTAPHAPAPALAAAGLTAVAMLAFAANSLLCRLALQQDRIDPASFGAIRLAAGALVLACVMRGRRQAIAPGGWRAQWPSAVLLFAYAALFSFAYVSLAAGTGALILFGAVQLTMLGAGLLGGERFTPAGWTGLALALAGLAALLLPGAAAPSLHGAVLMAGAGAAWGGYSLRGRGAADPLAATAASFVCAAPLGVLLALAHAWAAPAHADARGVGLAVVSGALTSGLGYVVWYAALRRLTAMHAAAVQLSVPPIAAFGGVLLLGEALTLRLGLASLAILGGIALVLGSRAARR